MVKTTVWKTVIVGSNPTYTLVTSLFFLEEFYMLYTIFQIGCIFAGSFILFPLLIYSLSKLIWLAMGGNENDF